MRRKEHRGTLSRTPACSTVLSCVSTPGVLEYSRVRSTQGDRGAPPHRRRRAAAAAHLDETQEVDGRGVQLLRLGVREQGRPGSVARDRRELHTPMFRSFRGGLFVFIRRGTLSTHRGTLSTHRGTLSTDVSVIRRRFVFIRETLCSHLLLKKRPQRNPTRSARGRTSNVAAMRGLACDATREVRPSGRERCIRSAS
jgi:hypothetical protein